MLSNSGSSGTTLLLFLTLASSGCSTLDALRLPCCSVALAPTTAYSVSRVLWATVLLYGRELWLPPEDRCAHCIPSRWREANLNQQSVASSSLQGLFFAAFLPPLRPCLAAPNQVEGPDPREG